MIKRDLHAWDFVKQEPKKGLRIVDGTGYVLTSDEMGHTTWTTTTITWNDDMTYGGFNTVIGGTEPNLIDGNNIVIGNGITVDHGVNNTVTISDLTVTASANIPPRVGELRYNLDTSMTEVYLHDEWLELGYVHEQHRPPKKSLWTRFKGWFKKIFTN